METVVAYAFDQFAGPEKAAVFTERLQARLVPASDPSPAVRLALTGAWRAVRDKLRSN